MSLEFNQIVGKRIRKIRVKNNLTLAEFGKKIDNANRATVCIWEQGRNLPNKERLAMIAKFGHVSLDYLLNGKTNQLSTFTTEELQNELNNRMTS